MFCQMCGDREATKSRVVATGFGKANMLVCDFCSDIIDQKVKTNEQFAEVSQKKCTVCGTTEDMIKDSLYVGCSNCYTTFEDILAEKINSYHGKSHHVGKMPINFTDKYIAKGEMKSASIKMNRAIDNNDIRLAKRARDEFFKSGGKI